MKSWVIYSCIVLAITASVYLYKIKYNQHPTVLEKFTSGLKDIHKHLSPYTEIKVQCAYGDPNFNGSKIVYILAPVISNLSGQQDTTLYVFPKDIAQDNPYYIESKKMIVIWQNHDQDIDYILEKKP